MERSEWGRGKGGNSTGISKVRIIVIFIQSWAGLGSIELGVFDFFELDHCESALIFGVVACALNPVGGDGLREGSYAPKVFMLFVYTGSWGRSSEWWSFHHFRSFGRDFKGPCTRPAGRGENQALSREISDFMPRPFAS